MSKNVNRIILGIESSCDETAAALVKNQGGTFKILANVVWSQVKIHQKYGGVVPEIAARNHVKKILPIIDLALKKSKVDKKNISGIAVATGPGLITSLLVGAQTAKTLAYLWQKPIYAINHLQAHLYANWLNNQPIKFPAVCLIVSGGHTELILMKNQTQLKKISETLDDAAGEAFDKVSQLLKLGYPGGPIVSAMAERGDAKAFKFPRPMIQNNNFNFSFSGLKTAVLYASQKFSPKKLKSYKLKANLCASFQQAVVEVLRAKTIKAAKYYNAKTIMLSGGVAANQLLRQTLEQKTKKMGLKFLTPKPELCTDNAAMIAAAAFFTKPTPWQKIKVDPNLSL